MARQVYFLLLELRQMKSALTFDFDQPEPALESVAFESVIHGYDQAFHTAASMSETTHHSQGRATMEFDYVQFLHSLENLYKDIMFFTESHNLINHTIGVYCKELGQVASLMQSEDDKCLDCIGRMEDISNAIILMLTQNTEVWIFKLRTLY
jgi:hypothetical protein